MSMVVNPTLILAQTWEWLYRSGLIWLWVSISLIAGGAKTTALERLPPQRMAQSKPAEIELDLNVIPITKPNQPLTVQTNSAQPVPNLNPSLSTSGQSASGQSRPTPLPQTPSPQTPLPPAQLPPAPSVPATSNLSTPIADPVSSTSPLPLPIAPNAAPNLTPIAKPVTDESTTSELVPPPIEGTIPDIVNPYKPDEYRLAIGDTISVFVANVPEFTTKNIIMSDGTVNLPVAGRLYLWGMTVAEASQAVTKRYTETDILRNPMIAVDVLSSTPLKIALAGQVNRPGAYNIAVVDRRLPTLTDAITFAGGIKAEADLNQVKVYRLNPKGGDQILEVNLWHLIQSADLSQDITLRSGDRILFAKAPIKPDEASTIGSANLSPSDMQIGILGEVLQPGIIKVPPNTTLNQALLAVGGFNQRAQVKTVEVIRNNSDGSVTRKRYRVNWSDSVSEDRNPILLHRDVVLVGRSLLTRYTDTLGKIFAPIEQTMPFFNIFEILFRSNKTSK